MTIVKPWKGRKVNADYDPQNCFELNESEHSLHACVVSIDTSQFKNYEFTIQIAVYHSYYKTNMVITVYDCDGGVAMYTQDNLEKLKEWHPELFTVAVERVNFIHQNLASID